MQITMVSLPGGPGGIAEVIMQLRGKVSLPPRAPE